MLVEVVVFIVDFQKESFHFSASIVILVLVFATDAKIERVSAFFLVWTFLETRSLASESKLDYLVRIFSIEVSATFLNDSFHVGSFAPDDSSGNLEFFFIVNLNVVSACIFDAAFICVHVILNLIVVFTHDFGIWNFN
jgi:hypothetical protein